MPRTITTIRGKQAHSEKPPGLARIRGGADQRVAFVMLTRTLDGRACSLARRLQREVNGAADFFVSGFSECETERQDPEFSGYIYSRQDLDFFFSKCRQHYRPSGEEWLPLPGRIDLVRLAFCLENPQYEHIWICEDDVRFSGHMGTLINFYSADSTDLLAPHLTAVTANWPNRNSLRRSDEIIPFDGTERMFMPFARFSRNIARCVYNEYLQDLTGHFEHTWPFVARLHGLSVRELGASWEKAHRQPLYSRRNNNDLGNGSFVYRPTKLFWAWPRQRLFHPVKPLPRELKFRAAKAMNSVLRMLRTL